MRLNDAFPSNYLKADDLEEDMTLTIKSVEVEEIGKEKDKKPVVMFRGTEKGLVLNKTNYATIAKNLGTDETDDWPGKKITLFATEVEMGGEMKMGIRVRLKKAGAAAPPKKAPPASEAEAQEASADEVPF